LITFPKKQALLSDRNVWIGDTGATQHMTAYRDCMMNIKRATSEDRVTVGNGNVEKTKEIGDLPGVICDQNGNKLTKTILKDVAIVPSSKYNLFSLTKAMKDGWELIGRKNRLTLKKGGQEVVFDIEIPTPRGVIYAMYLERGSEIAGAVTFSFVVAALAHHQK
jgi:hypothetical protein